MMKTAMNLLFHILRKDLRTVRPLLLAFGCLLPFQVVLSVRSPINSDVRLALEMVLAAAQGALAVLTLLIAVHADSFQGSTAFWKTRPLPAAVVLAAKATLAAAFLVLPFLLTEGLVWWLAGLDSGQMRRALGGLLLGLVPVLLAVFAVALSTRSLAQFAGVAGGLLLLTFLMVLGYESLRRQGWQPQAVLHAGSGRTVSALLVGGVLLSACAFTAVVASAFRRAGGWGIGVSAGGVVAYVGALLVWPDSFFQPPATPEPRAQVRLLREGEKPPFETGGQMLWSHFRVDALGTNQVAAVESFSARFTPENSRALEFGYGWPGGGVAGEPALVGSPQNADLFARIRSRFPAGTLWFGSWMVRAARDLPLTTVGPVTLFDEQVGRFSGQLRVREYTVEEVGVFPVARGFHRLGGGLCVDVRRVRRSGGGLNLEIREARPELLLDFGPRGRGLWQRASGLVYVLHNATTGEAFAHEPDGYGYERGDLYTGRWHLRVDLRLAYPEVRARLAGLSLEDWFRTARLHVFQTRRGGVVTFPFNVTDYVLRPGGDVGSATDRLEGLARIQAERLPEDPQAADYEAYVDRILLALPDTRDRRELEVVRQQLAEVGARGLGAFIARLPVDERLEYYVTRPLLKEFAGERHRPALEAALRRVPELAWLFRAKGWEAEGRGVLRQLLREQRAPLPAEALALAAEAAPPELYPAIRRNFELLERQHAVVHAALEGLPGFDLNAAVRAAWKRARFGLATPVEVALLAAPLGLPGALDAAIEAVEANQRDPEGGVWAEELRRLTGYREEFGRFGEWLSVHRGQFRFRPATRTYAPVE